MIKNSTLKYFTRLELENIKCFGTKQSLDLSDGNGNPTRWNLILANNGLGKTTLLQCLGWMRPEPANDDAELIKRVDDEKGVSYVRLNRRIEAPKKSDEQKKDVPNIITLVPSLQNVEDNSFFSSLPKSVKTKLRLIAEISDGKNLVNAHPYNKTSTHNKKKKDTENDNIITGIDVTFKENGDLGDYTSEGNIEIENIGDTVKNLKFPFIVVYGASRYMGKENKEDSKLQDPILNRLTETHELYDIEEILQDLDYARLKFSKKRDKNYFEEVENTIVRVLRLKSSEDIHINPTKRIKGSPNPDGVSFNTFSGEVGISALSLGYKTTLAWTLDLAWRLYENYPDSDDPLKEPAIVLIDELDLHLHPKWQLRIMDDLTETFPNVQFIATSHSPLLVQSASTTNFAVIQKYNDEVVIENEPIVIKSWRVDQILNSELFGLTNFRDKETEDLYKQRDELLNKTKRNSKEEAELRQLEEKILALPTATNPEDVEAMKLIHEAAQLLKQGK